MVKAYDSQQRGRFELTRTAAFLNCSPYLKKSATLNAFWPSPWERPKKVDWQPIDPEILANFNRHADEDLAKMNRNNGYN